MLNIVHRCAHWAQNDVSYVFFSKIFGKVFAAQVKLIGKTAIKCIGSEWSVFLQQIILKNLTGWEHCFAPPPPIFFFLRKIKNGPKNDF